MNLQEVLHENRMRMWEKEKARLKKQQRKESMLGVIVGAFIVVITIVLLVLSNSFNNKAIDSCLENGNTYNYCMSNL